MEVDNEKRMMLAFGVTFALLMVYTLIFKKDFQPVPAKPAATASKTAAGVAAGSPAAVPKPLAATSAATRAASLGVQQGSAARDIVVESPYYRVTLSTQGAVVKSWILRRYHSEKGQPLDLIDPAAAADFGYPLSLNTVDSQLATKLNTALFVAQPQGETLTAPAKINFVYSDGKQRVEKTIEFTSGYEIHVSASIFDGQHYLPVEVSWPGGLGDPSLPLATRFGQDLVVYGAAGSIHTLAPKKVANSQLVPGQLEFAGLEDRFFAGMFLPDSADAVFRAGRQDWRPQGWTDKNALPALSMSIGAATPQPVSFRLFVAPKDLDLLRHEKPNMEGLVDFGWYTVIAKPLFVALHYVYDHIVHNYGWAIILVTIAINTLLFPLKIKSIRSAQEMQRIAPKMKEIQERFKKYKTNDPRREQMNKEMVKLYQEHGVNPLGGCLPMLIQFPLILGFYRVLSLSIELRHAPWFGWLKDLSAPDPLYILPAVMVVTMFALQKMTPMATTDPAQARMMMVMPLVMGFVFFRLSSGTVLYYLTANIVGMAQQLLINRFYPAPTPLAATPPDSARAAAPVVRRPAAVK